MTSCGKIKMTLTPFRVRTGHGKPGKSWNLRISFSRPGKSWNFMVSHGKSWKIVNVDGKLITAVSKQG